MVRINAIITNTDNLYKKDNVSDITPKQYIAR